MGTGIRSASDPSRAETLILPFSVKHAKHPEMMEAGKSLPHSQLNAYIKSQRALQCLTPNFNGIQQLKLPS